MQELIRQLEQLTARIGEAITLLDIKSDQEQASQLQKLTLEPDFWNDSTNASAVSKQLATLQRHIDSWTGLQAEAEEALELARLELGGQDEDTLAQVRALYERANTEYERRQFELKLSGPHDRSSAILEIHAGAGGSDAQDWAEMLERMYLRVLVRMDWK